MNEDSLEFLPAIPDMPSPPNDPDDLAAWQAHIKTMDRYLLDLNEAIQKIEDGDFIKNFRQSLAQRGVDLDENYSSAKIFDGRGWRESQRDNKWFS